MSELQAYYDSFSRCFWAHREASQCGCRGRGYCISDVDTVHECPYHFIPGQPMPEDDEYRPSNEYLDFVSLLKTEPMPKVRRTP